MARDYLSVGGDGAADVNYRFRVEDGRVRRGIATPQLARLAGSDVTQSAIRRPFESVAFVGIEEGEGMETASGPQVAGYHSGARIEPVTDTLPHSGHARARIAPIAETVRSWAGRGAVTALAYLGEDLYVGFSNSVYLARRTAAGTWNDTAVNHGKAGVVDLQVFKSLLYITNSADSIVQTWSGAALATAWDASVAAGTPAGSKGGPMTVGFLNGKAQLFVGYSVNSGLQAFAEEYDGSTRTRFLYAEYDTAQAVAFHSGALYLAFTRGAAPGGSVLAYDGNVNSVSLIQEWPAAPASSLHSHQGTLFAGMAVGGGIEALGTGGFSEIAHFEPERAATSYPHQTAVRAVGALGSRLYAVGGSAPDQGWVRALERGGWHKTYEPADASALQPRALLVERTTATMLVGAANGAAFADGVLLRLPSTYSGSGTFTLPDFTGGMAQIPKAFLGAEVNHAPLVAGESASIYYALDDGAEALLLTSNAVGATGKFAPFPGRALRGKALTLRVELTGTQDGPEWISSIVDWKPSPDARETLQAELYLEDAPEWEDGLADTRSAREQYAALLALRRSDAGITVIDVDGTTTWVMRFPDGEQWSALFEEGSGKDAVTVYRLPISFVEEEAFAAGSYGRLQLYTYTYLNTQTYGQLSQL